MSSVRVLGTLLVFGLLLGVCAGQSATTANEVRPAIIQRSAQGVQVVTSQSAPAQLSSASFHAASEAEVDGMEKTLEHYVTAFESLNLEQVKQVWPELDAKHSKAFKDIFSAFKSANAAPRLGLQCSVPQVAGDTANVHCLETMTYSIGKGKTKEAGPARVEIELNGQADHWVLRDMKGAS